MWISCKQQHSRDDFRSGPPVKAIEFPDIWATRDQHALRGGGWSWAMVFPYGWWTKTFWTDASEYVVQMYKHIFHVCTGSIGLFCFDVPICLIFKCLWRHRHVSIFYQEKQYVHISYKYIICIICKKHVKKRIFKSPCTSYNTRHLHGLTMGSRPATSPGRALNLPVFSPQSWTITGSNAGRRVAVVRFLVASLLEERSDNFLVRWYPHEFFIFLLLLQHNHMLQCCPFSWPDKKQHFNNLTPSGDFDSQKR